MSDKQPSPSETLVADGLSPPEFIPVEHQNVGSSSAEPGEALAALFQQYRDSLMRFFARRLGADSDIEDNVQQVFLRIVKHSQQRPISNPRALLYVTASNIAKDERRRRRVRWLEHHDLTEQEIKCARPQPERIASDRQQVQILLAALRELESKYKRAFVLHRFGNMTYDQIAAEMGISVSSVQNYISLVMAHLRTRLKRMI